MLSIKKSTLLQLNDNRHDDKTTDTFNEIGNNQVSTIVTYANEQPLSRNTNDINAIKIFNAVQEL